MFQFIKDAGAAVLFPVLSLGILACAALMKDPPTPGEVLQVREDICDAAEVMPDTPEVVELRAACDASAPLADLVSRFERCKASLRLNAPSAGDAGRKDGGT